jgi:hypothetical protein
MTQPLQHLMEPLCQKQNVPRELFHHSTIKRNLSIRWQQVREDRIRNKQVRFCFFNIPKIESFINKRTATYVGKIARSKKLLRAWMNQPRKAGGQQLSCNNNFTMNALQIMLFTRAYIEITCCVPFLKSCISLSLK